MLSEAVKQSGILELVATFITNATANLDLWSLVAVFCAVVAVCTTFISHTVGAMVILPVVQTVGNALPVPHPRLMVMANVLMCSGAMGLPVSGAPRPRQVTRSAPARLPVAVARCSRLVCSWVVI